MVRGIEGRSRQAAARRHLGQAFGGLTKEGGAKQHGGEREMFWFVVTVVVVGCCCSCLLSLFLFGSFWGKKADVVCLMDARVFEVS